MDTLTIHVISSGIGESIVIGLPDKKWGVIDCYTPDITDPSKNPTIDFLRKNGVKELEFICLTHPHSDHYRGLRDLLLCFKIMSKRLERSSLALAKVYVVATTVSDGEYDNFRDIVLVTQSKQKAQNLTRLLRGSDHWGPRKLLSGKKIKGLDTLLDYEGATWFERELEDLKCWKEGSQGF